jgi:hypothetical protein
MVVNGAGAMAPVCIVSLQTRCIPAKQVCEGSISHSLWLSTEPAECNTYRPLALTMLSFNDIYSTW